MVDFTVLFQRFLEALPSIAGVTLAAIISGGSLLLIHHKKVKDELRTRAGEEVLRLKQEAYRQMYQVIYELSDEGWGLVPYVNWRRIRSTQALHVIAGSKEVVQLFYKILTAYTKEEKSKQDLYDTEVEITGMVKKLWNLTRKDLYDLEEIPEDLIVFYNPGPNTKSALEIWKKHRPVLEKKEVYTIEDLSNMNVDAVSQGTTISKDELEELKHMGARESRILREYVKEL